jgi:23S rRNA pseudouridine1911/1915/1917 synthase
MEIKVLYEDNHLIAVYKPGGILVQGDETNDVNLMDEVKKYLKEKYKKPGNVFLGLLHRLDRPASGIILFAKTSKGASRLSEQFRTHKVEKIYQALVLGKPKKDRGVLVDYLKKDEIKKKAIIAEKGNGQLAELEFEVEKSNEKYSLLKIKLKTGRFHQIRVQLSNMGNPIMGDLKYGPSAPLPEKNIALSAVSLSFTTATGKEKKVLSVDIPKSWENYLN